MTRYVAFLRGINLGNRRIAMDDLRRHVEELDVDDVATYLASGNVVFTSSAGPAALEEVMEAHLADALGYEVDTFVRTLDRVAEIAGRDDLEVARDNGFNPYVIFLREEAGREVGNALDELETPDDRFLVLGREVVWLRRGGISDSDIGTHRLEKALGTGNTRRNLNTVQRIAKKFGE